MKITAGVVARTLRAGDRPRFRPTGPSHFHCPGPDPVRYALVIVLP